MFQALYYLQNETVQNITLIHWSDEYSLGVQALIFTIEIIEWILLLLAVTGMYYGIEIGHPSKNYLKGLQDGTILVKFVIVYFQEQTYRPFD